MLVLVPSTPGRALLNTIVKLVRPGVWGKKSAKCEVYCTHVLSKVGVLGKGNASAQLDQCPDAGNMSSLQKEP